MIGSQPWGVFWWQESAGSEPTGSRQRKYFRGKIRKEIFKKKDASTFDLTII